AEVGLVMSAGALPRALLMLAGGVVADRFGPRRVVLGSDALRCVSILAVAGGIALTAPALWLLVVLALGFGVVDALFVPAVGALPPRITSPDQLARVTGMRSLAMRVGQIAGPPTGGLVMGLSGEAATFAVAGLLFALSLPLLFTVRMRPLGTQEEGMTPSHGAWHDLLDGLRYIRRHALIFPLVVVGALAEIGLTSTLNIGLVLLNDARHWGASGYGWIAGAFGGGAAASAALLTIIGWIRRVGLVLPATLFVACAGMVTIALVPSLPITVATAAAVGLAAGSFGALDNALIQAVADPAYLGRVTSVVMLTMVGLAPLGYPVVGAAIGTWGVT
ncbi:MFS transporter, partial [Streptomyces nanshensis]